MPDAITSKLLACVEPSVRYKVLVHVMDADANSPEVRALQKQIRTSPRVRTLLSERDSQGQMPGHAYAKWQGAHWVLSLLADLGYPAGDTSLIPLREQVYGWLLSEDHWRAVITREGRVRRCASQEGNALYSTMSLGIADERADELARRLILWQWPDGGWNCDRRPEADTSSFMESLIPLRALALHERVTGSPQSKGAAERCAEVFLTRNLYRRRRDGSTILQDFLELHYPCYWHYDILFGLKVMAEAGFIDDERCADALDVIEAKRLADGGFPAEARYYHASRNISGFSLVDWGGTSKLHMNEFVTADALHVLKAAGRLQVQAPLRPPE
jgi:hypothetical protein